MLKVVAVLFLAAGPVAGCGLFGGSNHPDDQRIQKLLEDDPAISVFLRTDVTPAQRTAIEAKLKALPDVAGVEFVTREAEFERMKQLLSAEPSKMPRITAEYLPESFRVRMTSVAAVREARDHQDEIKSLPGVEDTAFHCTTVEECRAAPQPSPTATPK